MTSIKKAVMIILSFGIALSLSQMAEAGFLEDLINQAPISKARSLDEDTIISGLKEALAVGTVNAVKLLSRQNGYFGYDAVKILLPDNIRIAGEVLQKAGFGKEVDNFVLSMNRAAEKAAPKARPIFIDAVKEMTFRDANNILNGGKTAATEYFKDKTSARLTETFKPVISAGMNEVGVTRSYKAMTDRYTALLPFAPLASLDLDRYVTDKALDGLFFMVGQEEEKIRTNPGARTTEILKKVFGR
jgi:hypothetical protein